MMASQRLQKVCRARQASHLGAPHAQCQVGSATAGEPPILACAQEAMYQPLGLECGHKFCADCAFSSCGKGNAVGR
jgi:hypothetical protein